MSNRGRNNFPPMGPDSWPNLCPDPCPPRPCPPKPCPEEQRHVHELQGSVKIADEDEPHNHRFATVTGEAMPHGANDHVHEVVFRTDFFEDHFHEYKGKTGCAIPVGNRHVHYIESVTSVNDGHRHEFEAATLIDNPIGDNCRHEDHHRDDNIRR